MARMKEIAIEIGEKSRKPVTELTPEQCERLLRIFIEKQRLERRKKVDKCC